MLDEILRKSEAGIPLTREDAVALLRTDNQSPAFYRLLAAANARSRLQYRGKAYIFVQIGLNADPCSGECSFCSLSRANYSVEQAGAKNEEDILATVAAIDFSRVHALFLMTTADYPQGCFLKLGARVRRALPDRVTLVANIGDFDENYARSLRQAGFDAAYHVVRLREGTDTAIPRSQRLRTLDAIRNAGLELYYCVEPIGREHTYEELADEMLRAREYGVDVMAVMGRIGVANTRFAQEEPLSDLELTKIAATARLVTDPKRSMNIHEPNPMALLAGVNQLYAEIGFNPRDVRSETEAGRGWSVDAVARLLTGAEYRLA